MHDQPAPSYRHTQKGPWSLILYTFGVVFLGIAWLLREEIVLSSVFPVAGIMMLVLGASFQCLTVADEGDRLAIRFGPLPLFKNRIRYVDIKKVEVGQTTFLDGWGIHMSLQGGWVWNLWGRECVVIDLQRSTLRAGTDDAENLGQFLKAKVAANGSKQASKQ